MQEFDDDIEIGDSGSESDEELYEHYRVVTDRKQEPLRIDKFLFNKPILHVLL